MSKIPDEELKRTYAAYVAATGQAIGYEEYQILRTWWVKLGGKFHGPNVEHGSMPESKLLPILRSFAEFLAMRKRD